MKGYRFKLESALRVRRLQEEAARARLARARLELDQAVVETSRRRGLLDRARGGADTGAQSLSDWNRERDRLDRLSAALKATQLAEAHAFDTARRSHTEWADAATAMKSLERLEEHDRQKWRDELIRREQAQLDDLTSAREARKRARGRR